MAVGHAWGNRLRCLFSAAAMAAGAFWMLQPTTVPAVDPGPVARVEEDWTLEIIEPAYDETSPQITNTLSPCSHLDCKFGLFEINHGTQPDYRDGGLEIQIWDHDERVNYRRHSNTNRLSYPGEVIKYTISMSLIAHDPDYENARRLRFEVKNGSSLTWGTFGDQDSMKCSIWSTRLDLLGYSPDFSVANSKVGYASFRVRKYALVQVRYYDENGVLIKTDSTERIAHQYNNDVAISE